MKSKFFYTFSAVVVAVVLALVFHKNILQSYAELFTIDNAVKGADAIVVLGGNSKTRPIYAVELLKKGYAKEILLTSPAQYEVEQLGLLQSEQDEYLSVLNAYDVNATIIKSTKGGATSTFDEAYDLVEYLKTHKAKKIIILTDEFHTARAHYAFKKVFNTHNIKDVELNMAAAPNVIFNTTNWYKKESGLQSYITEPFKFIFYVFNSSNLEIVEEH
ncbi:MAG: YdcF family protein [Campylobacterota bacterium]|nr:YdcF family protein [Campylobacterota bacterium]